MGMFVFDIIHQCHDTEEVASLIMVDRRSCQEPRVATAPSRAGAVLAEMPSAEGISALTIFGSFRLLWSCTEYVMFCAHRGADRELKYRLQR